MMVCFKIFKSSKVVLHPAIHDSGGMVACEAGACGLRRGQL